MKFTITLKDNETGKIINSIDANAIIAGISEEDKYSSLAATACNGEDLLGTLDAAKNAIKNTLEGVPKPLVIEFMKQFASDLVGLIRDEEGDNG